MRDLTIFSLNINKGLSSSSVNLHNMCYDSWKYVINFLISRGINVITKIYDENDIEFIDFYNKFKSTTGFTFENLKISHIADAFRLYIVANKPNHMWFDWDLLATNDFNIDNFDYDKKIFKKSFSFIYNGNELDFFKKVYNYIVDNRLSRDGDKKLVNRLLLSNVIKDNDISIINPVNTLNLFWLNSREAKDLIFVNEIDIDNKYYVELLNWIKNDGVNKKPNNYIFVTRNTNDVVAKNIRNNYDLIKFILNNYQLSKEQIDILNSWLE